MVNRRQLFGECQSFLARKEIDSYYFDALCIFQDIFSDKNPLFKPLESVPSEQEEKIWQLVKRRAEGYPLQYLLGQWEFYGRTFKICEGVLIPRPDTETLVDNVLAICKKNKLSSPKIIDLCSGSGCIAITLKKELPESEVCAVDISKTAVNIIRRNMELNNTSVDILKTDVRSPEAASKFGDADIIVCNPPYLTQEDMNELQKEVTFEPELALFGGADGLDFYRSITAVWQSSLKVGGWLMYEFGFGQHEDVKKILIKNGFKNIKLSRDAAGIIRTVSAQKMEE